MAKILIVSDELYPFTNGGIGRLTHNLLQYERSRAVHDLHLLIPSRRGISPAQVREVFEGRVTLHQVDFSGAGWAARWLPSHSPARRESLAIAQRIRRLQRTHGPFDVVEFPDYFGWGYATVKTLAAPRPQLAVRLHASRGLLSSLYALSLDQNDRLLVEQERFVVRHADVRVAHLDAVADDMAAHFQIPRDDIALHFPPVVWPQPTPRSVKAKAVPNFHFLSKIEVTKNPELFVDGCSRFFSKHKDYAGNAVLACHAFDRAYAETIVRRIDPRLRDRFVFQPSLSPSQWQMLEGQVVVVPSLFETLCLLAFEAQAVGATLCLNHQCPAFSGAPWGDDNCLRFSPNPESLCAALERAAFERPAMTAVNAPPQPQYWG